MTGLNDLSRSVNGGPEWRNIQDIVKSSFKSTYEELATQSRAMENMEAAMEEKASKKSITIALHRKVNKADLDAILAEKPSISDVNRVLANKPDVEAVNQALAERPTKRDISEYVEGLVNDLRRDVEGQMNSALDDIRRTITDVTATLTQQIVDVSAALSSKAERGQLVTQGEVNDRLEGLLADVTASLENTQSGVTRLSNKMQGVLQEHSHAITAQSEDLSVVRSDLAKLGQTKADAVAVETMRAAHTDRTSQLGERIAELTHQLQAGEAARVRLEGGLTDIRADVEAKVTPEAINELRADLERKADVQDVCVLFDTKSNVEDVNAALDEVSRTLNRKADAEQVRTALERQGAINDSLSSEHAMGRWIWKSGKVKSNNVVPWNVQALNTAPDNFVWVKDRSVITVRTGGLYDISCGMFGARKASVQCLVNGDPVFTTSGAPPNTVHHPVRSKLTGSITGLTHNDYISLPAGAKVQLTFTQTGESGVEGFVSLKKL